MDAHPKPRRVLPLDQPCICQQLRMVADLAGRLALYTHFLWTN